jgi:hypothetical protein
VAGGAVVGEGLKLIASCVTVVILFLVGWGAMRLRIPMDMGGAERVYGLLEVIRNASFQLFRITIITDS